MIFKFQLWLQNFHILNHPEEEWFALKKKKSDWLKFKYIVYLKVFLMVFSCDMYRDRHHSKLKCLSTEQLLRTCLLILDCLGNNRHKQPDHPMLSCGTFFLLFWLCGQSCFWISALLDNFPDAWKFEKHDSACLRTSELLSHCPALHNLESGVDIKILRQGMDINLLQN